MKTPKITTLYELESALRALVKPHADLRIEAEYRVSDFCRSGRIRHEKEYWGRIACHLTGDYFSAVGFGSTPRKAYLMTVEALKREIKRHAQKAKILRSDLLDEVDLTDDPALPAPAPLGLTFQPTGVQR